MSLRWESRQNPGDSIAEIARNVATVFARSRAKQLEPHLRSELENELGRFKIWAGNLGVFAPGPASADYRLRDDVDVKEVLVQMLDRLRQSTKQAMDPPVILEEEEELVQDDSSTTSSDDSMAISLDKDSDVGSEADSPSTQSTDVVSNALGSIKEIINRLYRLSTIIKKPSSSNENVKVANFMAKEEGSEELKEFETSVRWQIQFRLPNASPDLLDRLVDAAVFRRRKLEYRERHKEKLSQGVEHSFASELVVPLFPKETVLQPSGAQRKSAAGLRREASSSRGSLSTMQYSATEASSVNRLKFASYPKSVAPSGITKSAIARREQLDFPAPPSKPEGESKEAICPYCFRVIDREDMTQARWKRHILRDIEPYLVTKRLFIIPKKISDSTYAKNTKMLLTSLSSLLLSRKGHRLPLMLFISLAITLAGDENEPGEAGACPLCPFSLNLSENNYKTNKLEVSTVSDPATKKLCDHIAAHMEAIALLSLPERDDLEDANSNERESENTYHSLDQDFIDLPPASSIVDTEGSEQEPHDLEHVHGFEKTAEWWDYISMDDWRHILEDQRVKPNQYIEPVQDPTLQGFVRRARRAEMFRRWKINKIPLIIVYDPDGMESRPLIDGNYASSNTDDLPSITVSDEENREGHTTAKAPVDREFISSHSKFDSLPGTNYSKAPSTMAKPPSIVLHTSSDFNVTHEAINEVNEARMEELERAYPELIEARRVAKEAQNSQRSSSDEYKESS
ncbi:hypothetical protein DID88_008399 [Monilinia fructigena]|uniref:Oxidoreductase acuF-like C2H2 type zinc-finger domain-containing protein n=1 Tax=Monilinia fructigena TaxID=38457 RepID=A0A395J5C1_9HELO|nr:hypothetical protein DID88_008399 [Monilinia fructigena]